MIFSFKFKVITSLITENRKETLLHNKERVATVTESTAGWWAHKPAPWQGPCCSGLWRFSVGNEFVLMNSVQHLLTSLPAHFTCCYLPGSSCSLVDPPCWRTLVFSPWSPSCSPSHHHFDFIHSNIYCTHSNSLFHHVGGGSVKLFIHVIILWLTVYMLISLNCWLDSFWLDPGVSGFIFCLWSKTDDFVLQVFSSVLIFCLFLFKSEHFCVHRMKNWFLLLCQQDTWPLIGWLHRCNHTHTHRHTQPPACWWSSSPRMKLNLVLMKSSSPAASFTIITLPSSVLPHWHAGWIHTVWRERTAARLVRVIGGVCLTRRGPTSWGGFIKVTLQLILKGAEVANHMHSESH